VNSPPRTEPVGDCRVAINAVELTPGCPFAGKVRLKERKRERTPTTPRSDRGSGGAERRERVYNVGRPRIRLYFVARFAFRLASREPPFVVVVIVAVVVVVVVVMLVDVNDVFISDGTSASDNGHFFSGYTSSLSRVEITFSLSLSLCFSFFHWNTYSLEILYHLSPRDVPLFSSDRSMCLLLAYFARRVRR